MTEERKCAWCGARFSFGNSNRTLCSNRCKKARYNSKNRQEINAKQRAYNNTPQGVEAQSRYRSRIKAERAERRRKERLQKEAAAAARAMRLEALMAPKACVRCGVVFKPNCIGAKFCSRRCKTCHGRALYKRRYPEKVAIQDMIRGREVRASAARAMLLLPTIRPPEV